MTPRLSERAWARDSLQQFVSGGTSRAVVTRSWVWFGMGPLSHPSRRLFLSRTSPHRCPASDRLYARVRDSRHGSEALGTRLGSRFAPAVRLRWDKPSRGDSVMGVVRNGPRTTSVPPAFLARHRCRRVRSTARSIRFRWDKPSRGDSVMGVARNGPRTTPVPPAFSGTPPPCVPGLRDRFVSGGTSRAVVTRRWVWPGMGPGPHPSRRLFRPAGPVAVTAMCAVQTASQCAAAPHRRKLRAAPSRARSGRRYRGPPR